jgi:hypothetical protein
MCLSFDHRIKTFPLLDRSRDHSAQVYPALLRKMAKGDMLRTAAIRLLRELSSVQDSAEAAMK